MTNLIPSDYITHPSRWTTPSSFPIETHLVSPRFFELEGTTSTEEQQAAFDANPSFYLAERVNAFILNHRDKTENTPTSKVITYLLRVKSIDEIVFTVLEARQALLITKICDQISRLFKNSSIELRTKILQICSPEMTTAEAYTKTIIPELMRNREYLNHPHNWIIERTVIQARIVANALIEACALSKRLNFKTPTIIAVRGATAAGKNHEILTNESFKNALVDGELKGELDPDVFNYALRKDVILLTSKQTHDESISIFKNFEENFHRVARKTSAIVLRRISSIEDFIQQVLEPARRRIQGKIILIDIAQAYLCTLFLRILARDPFKKNPVPTLQSIIDGYLDSFKYRKKLLKLVKNESIIESFKLYACFKQARWLAVEKKDKQFKIIDKSIMKEFCKIPSDSFISKVLNSYLTWKLIKEALEQNIVPKSSEKLLQRNLTTSFSEEITLHCGGRTSRTSNIICVKNYLGNLPVEPFSTSWIEEFPKLIEHINSEHDQSNILDENGRGIHWPTNNFSTDLNPNLKPEARIQMRLGYYLIPLGMFKKFKTSEKNINKIDKLTFLHAGKPFIKFIVHPEAYKHFNALRRKFEWVPPLKSDINGTPTSSYRSWIVRIGKNLPFIIKMGVAATPYDTSRFFDAKDIEKYLQLQHDFESLDKQRMSFFEEKGGLFLKDQNFTINRNFDDGNFISLKQEPLSFCPVSFEIFPTEVDAVLNYSYTNSFGSTNSPRATSRENTGLIIRDIPSELLDNSCRIFSFASLTSAVEAVFDNRAPLIYDVIEATIEKGLASSSIDFIRKFLIEGYFQATEELSFVKGLSLSSHGQNLCWMLNLDNTPRKFIYRDFEGIDERNTLETYCVHWRFNSLIKLLNVLTRYDDDMMPPPPGTVLQKGQTKVLEERSVYFYLKSKLSGESLERIQKLSISYDEFLGLLAELDRTFYGYLAKYFYLDQTGININEPLPAAERGTTGWSQLQLLNKKLWQHRKSDDAVK